MSLQSENRHRAVLVGAVVPFVPNAGRRAMRGTCRAWQRWIPAKCIPPAARAPLTDAQVATVTASLRALRLPWSGATDRFLRETLRTVPCVGVSDAEADLPGLTSYLTCLYQRAVLPPKTNIGTLDTTRVIERLTQARLSRFHTTGAASMQQATNLDTLLHPTQSTRRPQMIVRLDAAAIDIKSARAVLDHLRGRLVAATFADFVREHAVTDDGGLRFELSPDAMDRGAVSPPPPPHSPIF